MPRELLRLTGDDLAGWYRSGLKRFVYGPATVKVDWALEAPIPWLNDEVRGAGTVHVGGSEEEFLASVGDGARRRCRRTRSCCSASRASRTARARPATSTPRGPTRTRRRQGIDWSAELDRHVERMEAQIERFAPGFRDRILARHVLGPGRARGAQPQPDRRRRRRRQLQAAPGAVPAAAALVPVQDAAERPLHRQRGDVPRRRGARRARRLGRARRARARPSASTPRARRRRR